MNRKKTKVRKVLVAMTINNMVSHRVLAGVLKHAVKAGWNARLLSYPESLSDNVVREAERLGYDGLLVNYTGRASHAVASTSLPVSAIEVYDAGLLSRRRRTAFVGNDNRAVGREGARHLLAQGSFRSWGFVRGPAGAPWTSERERGFTDALTEAGFSVHTFGVEGISRVALATWLTGLCKPAAVMCAWDMRAAEVLATCRELGISVPGEVSVVGVDGDEAFCDAMVPPLTSVRPDFERLGEMAAAALDRIIDSGGRLPSFHLGCPPRGVLQRESTAAIPPVGRLVDQAMEYIYANATKGVKARDVASRLNVSPQLLALRFRQYVKTSVRDMIIARRLDAVCRELKSTRRSFGQIAARCGFSSANRLAHLFKSRFGKSMGDYRRESGDPPVS